MAEEFRQQNTAEVQAALPRRWKAFAVTHEPHLEFKRRVPQAIGLIRTGDTIQYANVILESG